jgi:hypothetical protein
MGFEANSLVELGDHVGLASTSGTLTSLTVLFASFGCGVSGGAFSNDCVTNPGNATFTHPITAKIYAVNTSSGTPQPGALLATVTQTQTIPFRPSADRVNCTGAQAGKWFSPATGACQNAITQLLTFTFPAGTPLPSQVIWTVAFNTTHFGPSPIGPAPCNSSPSGCGYDSLNVGVFSFTGAPYIGTDVDPNGVFLNATNVLRNVAESTASGGIYCDGGPGGTLRLATPCWDGLRPLGEIKLN